MKIVELVGGWGSGGIETNLLNYFAYLEQERYQFSIIAFEFINDFFVESLNKSKIELNYLEKREGTGELKSLFARRRFLINNIERIKPDLVHINISNGTAFLYGHFVKKAYPGAKVIIHGHGDGIGGRMRIIKKLLYRIFRLLYEKEVDYCIACSKQINKWMFSERMQYSEKNKVIYNAIDTQRYIFNQKDRMRIRTELRIEKDTLLIGTIGRIAPQKNPFFILDIIERLKQSEIPFLFLWIGDGALRDEVKKAAKFKCLDSKIVFYGVGREIPAMLSAMDIFILPSLYEGLGIVNIEAQCSGLYTLVSDTTPDEAQVCNRFRKLPINMVEVWSETIKSLYGDTILYQRDYPRQEIHACGFEMQSTIRQMQDIFNELMEKRK